MALCVLMGVLLVGGGLFYKYASKAYGGEKTRLYIPSGTSPEIFKDSLCSALGDDFGQRVFSMWEMMSSDEKVRPGSYIVNPGEQAWKLARRINNRVQDPVMVTFKGLRLWPEFTAVISRQMNFTEAEFAEVADSILQSKNIKRAEYPAVFFPESHEFYWTDSPQKVVERMYDYYSNFWNETRQEKARSLGLSPIQAATLASIVEEESNKIDERSTIARLYLNRLQRGMKLQADPTLKYAAGDFALQRILNKHKLVQSPYNTYLNNGLPPGPIRFPLASTVDQVLNAPANNYIFMCAKEDLSGYHNFATDYATHQANAARYQREIDRRGIK